MGPGHSPLLGTWKLRSLTWVDTETGKQSTTLGIHPVGYLNYSSDGRVMAILLAENRVAPGGAIPSDSEAAALFKTMVAYTGTFTVQGNQVTHYVDASWNEAWTGSQLIRSYKLDGNSLTITTARARHETTGRLGVATLVWERVRGGEAAAATNRHNYLGTRRTVRCVEDFPGQGLG